MDQIGENQPTVFSACAEVVPQTTKEEYTFKTILRVRGGSSTFSSPFDCS